ncbi:MAG: hypothetical protein SFV15_23590 [Polyangiaceae bacterium]|nr:hypothetical protein [Polyangiaceae bacterium]
MPRPHDPNRNSSKTARSRTRGFTAFEAGLGTCVVAILALGTTAWVAHSKTDERVATAHHCAQVIHAAAAAWRTEGEKTGCPTVAQLVHEGYLQNSQAKADPWGERFRVHCTSGSFVVYSAGPDARLQTADDVHFPEAARVP